MPTQQLRGTRRRKSVKRDYEKWEVHEREWEYTEKCSTSGKLQIYSVEI